MGGEGLNLAQFLITHPLTRYIIIPIVDVFECFKDGLSVTFSISYSDTIRTECLSKLITFKIDGKTIGSYEKSNDPNRLAKGQWTFDRPFYIILNQSVGNDTWHTPDYHHTYETQIDWVRVYQRREIDN